VLAPIFELIVHFFEKNCETYNLVNTIRINFRCWRKLCWTSEGWGEVKSKMAANHPA